MNISLFILYKISQHCTYFYIHFQTDALTGAEMDEQPLQELLKHNKMEALQGKNITDHIIIPKLCHARSHIAYDTILHLLNRGSILMPIKNILIYRPHACCWIC